MFNSSKCGYTNVAKMLIYIDAMSQYMHQHLANVCLNIIFFSAVERTFVCLEIKMC